MPYSISEQAACVTVSKYITRKCPGITQFFSACKDICTSVFLHYPAIASSFSPCTSEDADKPAWRCTLQKPLPCSAWFQGQARAKQQLNHRADMILASNKGHSSPRAGFGFPLGNEEWQGRDEGPRRKAPEEEP